MRKKIAWVGIRFSVTTVVTTIVTTVATTVVTTVVMTVVKENCMPTHAIFILMSNARCWAPSLRKNRPSWMTTMRRSTQHSPAQKSREPSNDEHTFSCVCCRCCDSWNILGMHGVLLRSRNSSKPHVSRAVGVRVVTMVPGKCDCSY